MTCKPILSDFGIVDRRPPVQKQSAVGVTNHQLVAFVMVPEILHSVP
jgi:hypothetical protein